MLHVTSKLISAALVIAFTAPAVQADKLQPTAEILHWWSSQSESDALAIFINEFDSRGGRYYDSSKDNEVANREEAIERMGKGYPATLTQWNAGKALVELDNFGLLKSIRSEPIVQRLKGTLPDKVLDAVTSKGDIVGIPLNIHTENWMWYSQDRLGQSEISLSGDWQDFFAIGDSLAAENIPLLAVGNQSWQVRILFTSVLLSVSRDIYSEFFIANTIDVVDSDEFRTALTVFNKLASYSESFGNGNWDTQIEAVIEDRAAANFMGDWARGVFRSLDQEVGKDYGCLLTSTDDPSLLMVIDTLVLGNVDDDNEIAGQELMLDVILDPEVNLQFNALKGSISPYARPDPSQLDACTSQVYAVLDREEAVVSPYQTYFPDTGEYAELTDYVIMKFWEDSLEARVDSGELIAQAAEEFRGILENNARDKAVSASAED